MAAMEAITTDTMPGKPPRHCRVAGLNWAESRPRQGIKGLEDEKRKGRKNHQLFEHVTPNILEDE